jgi:hypothetical protein
MGDFSKERKEKLPEVPLPAWGYVPIALVPGLAAAFWLAREGTEFTSGGGEYSRPAWPVDVLLVAQRFDRVESGRPGRWV